MPSLSCSHHGIRALASRARLTRISSIYIAAILLFLAGLRPAEFAAAATKTWSAGSSSWATPQNWSPMPFSIPTIDDTAQISNGGTARVTQNATANTVSLATAAGSTGNLDISSGATLGTLYAYIGDQGTGVATVSGAGSKLAGNNNSYIYEFRIGRFGSGRLDILSDATVASSYSGIAWEAGSTGVVNVLDSANWENTNWLEVGVRGNGTLNIRSGGEVSADSGTVGSISGSTGRVEIEGSGSKLATAGSFWIGYEGIGTVSLADGAALTTATVWGGDALGVETLGRGTVDIAGGSTWNNYSLSIGGRGQGFLNILDGVVTSTYHGTAGGSASGNGEILVEGPISKWINRSLTIGNNGRGTLTIRGGALVDSKSGTTGGDRDSYIGRRPGSTGIVNVEGNNTKWLNGGNLEVGGNFASTGGSGTLNIRTGAHVAIGSVVDYEPRLKIWQQGQVNLETARLVIASGDSSSLPALNGVWVGTSTTTGVLELEGGQLNSNGPIRVATQGSISGSGTITAPVTEVSGKVWLYQPRMNFPGSVLPREGISQYNANLVFNGNLEQKFNSEISLTNLTAAHQLVAGATHSTAIIVNGTASLGGKLSMNFTSGYAPPVGARFGIISANEMFGQMELQNVTLPHVNGMPDRFLGVNYRRNGEGGDPVMEVITLEQPRRVSPERTPRPRNLLVVTHGTNADADGWVTDLAFGMMSDPASRWLTDDWEVVALDWRSFNGGSADQFGYNFLAHPEVSANTAAGNAINIGQSLVRWYTARGITFDNVHVLGHSAGTWLADAVADAFAATPHPEHVHTTLFDAWNPPEGIRHQAFDPPAMADKADYADHYFHRNSAVWYTDTTFPTAVNLDLTEMEYIVNPINSHAKPYNWYIETALSPTDPAVAIDGWGAPNARIFRGAPPTYGTDHLGGLIQVTPDGSFVAELDVQETAFNEAMNVTTGDVSILPNDGGAILATASPAILNTMLNLEKAFEAVQFDFEFLSANPGLLSVYFAGQQIFAFENGPLGLGPGDVLSSGLIWLGQEYAAGPHSITFRIDPLTELQTSIKITDLEFVSLVAAAANLPGDFNHDNKVDAADYVVWRKTDGTLAGYNAWRTHFGQGSGNGSSASENGAVPEPLAISQLLAVGVLVSCRRGNWRR